MKKKYSLLLTSLMSFSVFMVAPTWARASSKGKTTTQIAFRSKPTTQKENGYSNIYQYLDGGTVVEVNSDTKVNGYGCDEGWLNITYKNKTGYACSKYISFDLSGDIYDRPWNSPKKAIVGGAKFISSGYISKGQYTSYLKKFNVNPDSKYSMYNHQYMSNIAAPSSEAKTSFKAYSNSGLINNNLTFSIPVYNNMADRYDRPTGNLASIPEQNYVSDYSFESALDREGFPESYKKYLRAIHNSHSNWSFKAMKVGVNFEDAAWNEKPVSLIGNYSLRDGDAEPEKGWYYANIDAVKYYMDPRNFLNETYILQFEDLSFSETQNESVVQSILSGTFMSGYSFLDNQSYASIFVEAGRGANVSSVYLASLAIQESGRNGGSNTNGAAFEYEGVNYNSLYNFFNIGAVGSASNPSKAGLVWASGGVCENCESANAANFRKVSLSTFVNNAGLRIDGGFIRGLNEGMSLDDFRAKLANEAISINSNTIGTGTVISYNGEEYSVVISGDLTGDGVINSADLLRMRQYLLGKAKLNGAHFKAGAISDGKSISSKDLLKLRQHLLGNKIRQ